MKTRFEKTFKVFKKAGLGSVRTVISEAKEIWFVGADVCNILGIVNPSNAYKRLLASEKMTLHSTEGHSGKRGGAQTLMVVSESGLYTLVMGSRKKEALDFQRWVTGEVLPSIRKYGGYIFGQEDLSEKDRKGVENKIKELAAEVEALRTQNQKMGKELAARNDCLDLYEKMNAAWYKDYLKLLDKIEKTPSSGGTAGTKSSEYFYDNHGNRYNTREAALEAIKSFD